MNDIKDKSDVILFVNAFYSKVKDDDTIGPIFKSKIPADHWPVHLERMYSFWNTVLFGQIEYRGNPFSKHISLPIDKEHFDMWIDIFERELRTLFSGPKTEETIDRARKMRMLFESKLNYIRSNSSKYPIL